MPKFSRSSLGYNINIIRFKAKVNRKRSRSETHLRPLVLGKGRRRSCKKRVCRNEMVCGRFMFYNPTILGLPVFILK